MTVAKKTVKKTSAKKPAKLTKTQKINARSKKINDAALAPKKATRKPVGASVVTKHTVDPKVLSPMVTEAKNRRTETPKALQDNHEIEKPRYVPTEIQGHAIQVALPRTDSNVITVDARTGEPVANPAELVLKDDVERYYSHSFIKQYTDCSAAAYYRKTGAPSTAAFALERGSAIHGAIETFIKTADAIRAMDVFEENWKLMVLDKQQKMSQSDQAKIKSGYEETKRMLQEFILENDELIQQRGRVQSELEFSVPVTMNTAGGSFTRRIYGKIDFIVWNKAHTAYKIFDFKSSAQVPSDPELDREVQFALYQYACTVEFGYPPMDNYFYYLRGQHVCKVDDDPTKETIRFSKEKHPRPTTAEGVARCLKFAFSVKLMSDEALQMMFDTYYSPAIVGWEAGIFQKNLSDTRKCVTMCNYKEHCDTVKMLPLPIFVRIENGR